MTDKKALEAAKIIVEYCEGNTCYRRGYKCKGYKIAKMDEVTEDVHL